MRHKINGMIRDLITFYLSVKCFIGLHDAGMLPVYRWSRMGELQVCPLCGKVHWIVASRRRGLMPQSQVGALRALRG